MREAPPLLDVQDESHEPRPGNDAVASTRRFKRLLDQIRHSRESGDGQLILLTEAAAMLAAQSGQVQRVEALLELAAVDPWHTCLVVSALARRANRLEGEDLSELVRRCMLALDDVPPEEREGLLEDLAHDGHHAFLRAELAVTVKYSPIEEVSERIATGLRRLPPSGRAQLDLDLLVRTCLERLGPEPLLSRLEPLFQTIALRDLKDDGLREALVDAYARGLEPADVRARHRDRLLYLSRYANDPAVRSRVLVRHDLARMAALPRDLSDPELLLEQLAQFPTVLTPLPEREAQTLIGYVLRRLVRRLTDDDHLRLGRTLCDPERPDPFFTAYQIHLKTCTLRASQEVQLELWHAFFAAWLSHRAGELGPVMRPFLRSVARGLDRELKVRLHKRLKPRFGEEFQGLCEQQSPDDTGRWRWRWPWSERQAVKEVS